MRFCSHPPSIAFTGLISLSLFPNAWGARLPFYRRDDSGQPQSTHLNYTNKADAFSFGVANFQGDGQTIYFITLTVDGQDFAVNLDTGSADLWLDTTNVTFSSNVTSTNQTSSLGYGDGTVAEGPILVADVQIGDFVVAKQAFISAQGTNATSAGDQGLLGVGPPSLSRIDTQLNNTAYDGTPLLQSLFSLYPNESSYITFSLNRSIYGVTDGGAFTIGEVDPAYSSILNATHLPVLSGSSQWETIMDSIFVNGKNISGGGLLDNSTINQSEIPTEYQHKLLTLLDTGTALATGPQSYVDAIYSSVPGAELIPDSGGIYELPCDTKLNISMVLGGIEYPLNPLDAIMVGTDADNVTVICASTISYTNPALGLDWILGDAFMRNVYSLFNYGSFINANASAPYVQLLSVTDKDQAWAAFDAANAARIASFKSYVIGNQGTTTSAGTSTIVSSAPSASSSLGSSSIISSSLASTSTASSASGSASSSLASSASVPPAAATGFRGTLADVSTSSDLQDNYNTLMRNSWIIIGLLGGVAVLLVGLLAILVMRGRQERKYQPLTNLGGPAFATGKYETPYDS